MLVFASLTLLVFSLAGCYYDVESELYPAESGAACDTAASFATVIQPLVTSSCAISGCHVSGGQTPNLSDYASIKANVGRVRIRATVDKSMPPSGPLSNCSTQALQRWIDNGAPNN